MKSYSAVGVILKRRNFSEADRIITIFTKYHGKIYAIAKGVRKITSRKAPSLEPFTLCKLFIVSGKNLDIITETELISSFPSLRKNLKSVTLAYEICEMIDRLLPEKQINRSLFELIINSFNALNDPQQKMETINQEEVLMKILWDLGYLPENRSLHGVELSNFIENILEKKLKSRQLLTKIEQLI